MWFRYTFPALRLRWVGCVGSVERQVQFQSLRSADQFVALAFPAFNQTAFLDRLLP